MPFAANPNLRGSWATTAGGTGDGRAEGEADVEGDWEGAVGADGPLEVDGDGEGDGSPEAGGCEPPSPPEGATPVALEVGVEEAACEAAAPDEIGDGDTVVPQAPARMARPKAEQRTAAGRRLQVRLILERL